MEILSISLEEITSIARNVFGSSAAVQSIEEIVPFTQNGILKIHGCRWNLSYIVSLRNHHQNYLFRFNRRKYGRGDDILYEEAEKYCLISKKTDIPIPGIYCLDTSHSIVPTGYMVMGYMPGNDWRFLTHPRNHLTSAAEKAEIQRLVGRATAQIHCITRKAPTRRSRLEGILTRLDQLTAVIRDTRCRASIHMIEQCKDITESHLADPALHFNTESFCINDAEFHLTKNNDKWGISFICDLEWSGYGDQYNDIATQILPQGQHLWTLKAPLHIDNPESLRQRPIFKGYEEIGSLDYTLLSDIAPFAHLRYMCSIALEMYDAGGNNTIEEREPPIFYQLLNEIIWKGKLLPGRLTNRINECKAPSLAALIR